MVGAHQALKYRALRAGQLNTTEPPHAFLVAYNIPRYVAEFCARHGVAALELGARIACVEEMAGDGPFPSIQSARKK